MLQHQLYLNANDRMTHLREILSIANDLHRPISEITQLYDDVFEYLRAHARVTNFLPILVSKKVRKLGRRAS